MPAHHPVPPAVFPSLLLPRHERERIVDAVCDRLSEELDSAVASLRELVQRREARLHRRWSHPASSSPHHVEA